MNDLAVKPTESERYLLTNNEWTNEQYHSSDGISKSGLDQIAKSPAVYQWSKNAPVDKEKTGAQDLGTALHTKLLEPNLFDEQFAVLPELDLRYKADKEIKAQFDKLHKDKTILSYDDGRKLNIMCESALAHPAARFLLESAGQCESSIYWTDEETDELCKCRPDKILQANNIVMDVKKVADIARFKRSLVDFRYHVQAAMYADGYKQYFGEAAVFMFLVISESVECGRYPVRVFVLDDVLYADGYNLYRRDLKTYHHCKQTDNWGGFEELEAPHWMTQG